MKAKFLRFVSIMLSFAVLIPMTIITPKVLAQQSDVVITNLRTDYEKNPVGIDSEKPILSWEMQSSLRGVLQTNYQIIVKKDSTTGTTVWDSGKVNDGRSVNVTYEGETLLSKTVYFWAVKVWDNMGGETISEFASFETGLLSSSDWSGAKWIKHSLEKDAPKTSDIKNYTISMDVTIKDIAAGICFAGIDESHFYMWQLNIETEGHPTIRAHRWNGGAELLDTIDIGNKIIITKDVKYNVKFIIEGKVITTFINDIEVNKYTNSVDFGYGKVGFRSTRSQNRREVAAYDNIKVESVIDSTNTILFSEDFSDAENFQFTDGRISEGQLIYNDDENIAWDVFSWQKDTTPVNNGLHYTCDLDFQITQDNVGVIFSANNTGNFFMWAINTKDVTTPYLRRHIFKDGGVSYVQDIPLPSSFTKSDILTKEHHLTVEVENNVVKTTLDTVLIDTYTDYTNYLVDGYIGFRFYNEGARFDNVKYVSYDGNTPTTKIDSNFDDGQNPFNGGKIVDINGNKKLLVSSSSEMKVFENKMSAVSMFRKDFTAQAKTIKSARIYASSLGVSDLYINGARIGKKDGDKTTYDELKPGWTDYDKSVFYLTYDVTDMIKSGNNAIGAEVGSGWYNGIIAVRGGSTYSGLDNGLLIKLDITYNDDTTDTIVTDNTWKTLKDGNVSYADIYNGEIYDANKDSIKVWSGAGYDASKWYTAKVKTDFTGAIKSAIGSTVQTRPELSRTPISITKYQGVKNDGSTYGAINNVTNPTFPFTLEKGKTVIFDMGQNITGWENFTAKGTKNTVINIRFAEMLNDSGQASRKNDGPKDSIYTANYDDAKSSGQYIMNGNQNGETYNPRFTFYGFRYVELTATEDTIISNLDGIVVDNANQESSSFVCSDPALNQLYSNIKWGQRDNFLSTATDCPQRNERLGWTADTHIFSRTATYNADTAGFYRKWLADLRDSQFTNGAYPDIVPNTHIVGGGNGGWAEAGIIVPYNVYLMYGDIQLIQEHFASMEKFMGYLAAQAGNGYLYNGGGAASGDWNSPESNNDDVKRYISVTYYAYSALLMAKMSAAIGDTAKENTYQTLFNNIKNEFNTRYVNSDGTLNVATQTTYLLALKLDLFATDTQRDKALDTLINKIKNNGNKLSTGFIGTSILNQTLSDLGANDIAYTLLLQRNNPSWLYSVDQGATTIWENWDGYTIENGFKDPSMNSFNHYSYGAVGEWMYRYMAGIETDSNNPGFKKFILQPTPDTRAIADIPANQNRITSVKATYGSIYGEIGSEWQTNTDGRMNYTATVPANTTATLYLPLVSDNDVILLDNTPIASVNGVSLKGVEKGKAIIELGSGTYNLKVTAQEIIGNTDKTTLKTTIDNGEIVKLGSKYTSAITSVQASFDAALTGAKTVYANNAAEQNAVDLACDELLTQIQKLDNYQRGDKTSLQLTYDAAVRLNISLYTDGTTKDNFTTVVGIAKNVLDNKDAMQPEIDKVKSDLVLAGNALVLLLGKTQIQTAISEADKIMLNLEDNYVTAGKAEFIAALAAAKALSNNVASLQADMDAAATRLLNAMMALRYKSDKATLQKVLNQASGINLSIYTVTSVKVFNTAKSDATQVYNNANVSKSTIETTVVTLQTAINNLTLINVATNAQSTSTTNPHTGDSAPLAILEVLLVVAGATVVFVRRRRLY